ncbi:hypothetical protein KO498_15750 [Lentibacter algarum]|uniref:hypothetical protein n=1 Tax=Lentibacter algarum TaxID=576131 RepID=UPI001C0889C3|nr:hypothetical protein [Lentibacter algarum]MBU2983262.1 hypothetical protein [Lentibacter algarum]
MEADFETIRQRILYAYGRESDNKDNLDQTARIKLNSGDWVDGRLLTAGSQTFVLRRVTGYRENIKLEIPYHAVSIIELRTSAE